MVVASHICIQTEAGFVILHTLVKLHVLKISPLLTGPCTCISSSETLSYIRPCLIHDPVAPQIAPSVSRQSTRILVAVASPRHGLDKARVDSSKIVGAASAAAAIYSVSILLAASCSPRCIFKWARPTGRERGPSGQRRTDASARHGTALVCAAHATKTGPAGPSGWWAIGPLTNDGMLLPSLAVLREPGSDTSRARRLR